MTQHAVRRHYLTLWGQPSAQRRILLDDSELSAVDVLRWTASPLLDVTQWATVGLSALPARGLPETHHIELIMGLDPAVSDDGYVIGLMKVAASIALNDSRGLAPGHTITMNHPLWPGTTMHHLVAAPAPDLIAPSLPLPGGEHIAFLLLIPLYEGEMRIERVQGMNSLWADWNQREIQWWDPFRQDSRLGANMGE